MSKSFTTLQQAKADLYLGNKSSEEVEATLAALSPEDLAAFIVDAMNRGWISCFNMGLNEDGEAV